MDVQWRLHFEFYLSTSEISHAPSAQNSKQEEMEPSVTEGPSTVDVEPMTWDLPVKIVPCNPMHASAISLLRTTSSFVF